MRKNTKRKWLGVIKIATSLLLLGILAAFADVNTILQSLNHYNLPWLLAVFGFIALSMIISAQKWKILLDVQSAGVGLIKLFRFYIIALFFNNFLPSSIGGDGVRIYLAGRESGKTAAAAASVIVERSLATVSLALLGLGGALFARNPSHSAVLLLGILLVAGSALTGVLIGGWYPDFVKNRPGEIWKAWIAFAESAGELRKNPKALVYNIILSVAFQITVAFVVGSIMAGLEQTVPPLADLFFITSASSVLAMAPVGVNGYGLREGAYIFLLQSYGYTVSSALTVSVLFAIFVSLFSLIGGINWILSRPIDKSPDFEEMVYEQKTTD